MEERRIFRAVPRGKIKNFPTLWGSSFPPPPVARALIDSAPTNKQQMYITLHHSKMAYFCRDFWSVDSIWVTRTGEIFVLMRNRMFAWSKAAIKDTTVTSVKWSPYSGIFSRFALWLVLAVNLVVLDVKFCFASPGTSPAGPEFLFLSRSQYRNF